LPRSMIGSSYMSATIDISLPRYMIRYNIGCYSSINFLLVDSFF
jgi:hypothetical protein